MSSILKKSTAFLLGAVLTLQLCLPLALKADDGERQVELSGSVSRAANYTEALKEYPEALGKKEQVFTASGAVASEGAEVEADGGVLSSEAELKFSLNVAEAGRYNVRIEYKIAGGAATTDVVRKIKLNGAVPFSEAERIIFSRSFVDEGEITLNTSGDEIRPGVKEVRERRTTMLYDSVRFYSEPLQFWFESGVQTFSLEYVSSDMYIYSVALVPVTENADYKTVSAGYKNTGAVSGKEEFYQAEASMTERSDSSIRMESNSDPAAVPQSKGYKKLNVVGGNRWREGNQRITYSFDVPESGYYKISLRFLQSWNDGMPSYRRIELDGGVPCRELEAYRFEYNSRWQTETLNVDGEEVLFYLEKGTHQLSMTVVLGELSETVKAVYDNMLVLSDMIQSINKLTGGDADPNYDYEFFKNIPSLEEDMNAVAESLAELSVRLDKITSKSTSMSGNLKSTAGQIRKMADNPFTIAKRIDQLTTAQTNLGTYYSSMQSMPLMLDEFSVASPDVEVEPRTAGFFQKIAAACYNFILSFSKDYNGVSGTFSDGGKVKETINVWVARGTEWAETIKYLSDAEFTPESGVLVNMKIVPSSQLNTGSANVLLLSIVSGKTPDVAMGVSAASPVEFAIRDSVCDLSVFEDFDEVGKRFIDKIFIPFTYDGGVYALPETMNFNCLFYRKDIFSKYSFKIPDTWQELSDDLLPKLYQNGMEFYMPQDFTTFLFQNGGTYYTEDGRYSALSSNEAYRGFKQYTEMFTHYGVPVNANLLARFRTGEMPIGIGAFAFYIQLQTAAPELVGSWEIAPLPGTLKQDGTVDRSTGGLAAECDIILTKDSSKKQAAWEFLKWWTSDETQITYAAELESTIGVEARWNSANSEAFSALDWSVNDRAVIEEMWNWATEIPVVLGGYYTTRYIGNAFNSVVVSGNLTVRDALEEAVEAINKELETKQIEYGVISSD